MLESLPIGSTYGIYANIGGILMVNVTIYGIHGSYGLLLIATPIWQFLFLLFIIVVIPSGKPL